MTDFMEQKFGSAIPISEGLIHTAYNNCLTLGALHHEALTEIVKYVNVIAQNSNLLSFVHQLSDIFLVEKNQMRKLLFWSCTYLWLHHTTSCRCMSLYHYRSTSTFPATFPLRQKLAPPT
jgi:hypothetical protein